MSLIVQDLKYAPQAQGPEIIRNVTFAVTQGELCTLVGPSGSGKSTLLQLIAGLLKPTHGTVDHTDTKKRAALVFQYPERHFFNVTVYDELTFGLRHFNLHQQVIDQRIDESLTITGAFSPGLSQGERKAFLDRSPFSLSGGEQRAVAIAVALVLQPGLLLLDEPTAGLDPANRRQFFDLLDVWRKRHSVTTVVVSHDLAELSTRTDRVLALQQGRVAYHGLPADFFYDGDLLRSLGLKPPPVPELVQRLRQRGIDLDQHILRMDDAVDAIAQAVGPKYKRDDGSMVRDEADEPKPTIAAGRPEKMTGSDGPDTRSGEDGDRR